MYICIYVYVYVCVCMCVYTYIYIYIYIYIHTYIYVIATRVRCARLARSWSACSRSWVPFKKGIYIYILLTIILIYIYIYIYTYVCMYVYIYIYIIHEYVYIYIYIYIHTYSSRSWALFKKGWTLPRQRRAQRKQTDHAFERSAHALSVGVRCYISCVSTVVAVIYNEHGQERGVTSPLVNLKCYSMSAAKLQHRSPTSSRSRAHSK